MNRRRFLSWLGAAPLAVALARVPALPKVEVRPAKSTTGALVFKGGIGISGYIYVGGLCHSTSTTTGALIVHGSR